MIRIFLAALFTLTIAACLNVVAPEGNWIYLAGLVAATAGMTTLCIFAKEI